MYLYRLRMARRGMTLVEVIVSFAIIAIVLVMVLAALTTSANVKMKGDAFTLAEENLTESIAAGANADDVGATDLNTGLHTSSGKEVIIPGKAYTYDDDEYDKTFRIVGQ
ncbi:MAG: type II secretion system GspH family protein [Clostridiales Family XIII bacterium]|nr:type II secretion system GspH family protein [Clostridiales Family XIII bacterium]